MEAVPESESRFVTVFETVGNIFALNVLWIVFSIPLVTIGASTTALYSVMLKVINKEEGPIVKSFWNVFRSDFKKSTISWLIIVAALVGIWGELFFAYTCNFQGGLAFFYLILGFIELVIVCLVLPFLFPLIARYENSLWNTFKNALLLSVSNLGSWVKIFLAWFVPIFVCMTNPAVFFMIWYLWILIIIGTIAYGTSFTVRKVLRRIEHVQKQKDDEQVEQKPEGTARFGRRRTQASEKKVSIREQANLKVK